MFTKNEVCSCLNSQNPCVLRQLLFLASRGFAGLNHRDTLYASLCLLNTHNFVCVFQVIVLSVFYDRVRYFAQCLESSFAYPGQFHIRQNRRSCDNLSWDTSERRKIALVQNFPRVKLEWTEWMWHLSCSLCCVNCSYDRKTAVFSFNVCASIVPLCAQVCRTESVFFLAN